MSTPGDDRAQKEARNAAMRETVDQLMDRFNQQTAQLREAQQAASELTAELSSPDGLVKVTVDAQGTLADLKLAPTTFERTRPDALARTISDLVRRGMLQVKQQQAELFRPLTADLPDLSEFIEGAPSLAGLMPDIPDFLEPEPEPRPAEDPESQTILRRDAPRTPPPAPKPAARRARPTGDDDEMPDSWMTRGDR
ncbi:YbaB/EbfC family nucleoid-associated protein [Amycolatopsis thermophila]|uniref:DNA-binding protein YbaB n=1 Tax=Amycolatopsis thermophila TaxID=206084 RepID=A0ABU0ESG2_9PSEU|nr:YbaB/EbfC family nucleoid-associated protein [Amycolatopsis thermophila]MDQ0378244.1 DNA-binding protein YbaB [Amycolatopsis thermophila]